MSAGRSGLWANVPLGDLDRIRRLDLPAGTRSTCRSLYVGLAEISLEAYHKPFGASRERLAAVADISVRTVDACIVHLADAGLVKVTKKRARSGRVATTHYQIPRLARLNAPIASGNGRGPMTPDKLAKLVGG